MPHESASLIRPCCRSKTSMILITKLVLFVITPPRCAGGHTNRASGVWRAASVSSARYVMRVPAWEGLTTRFLGGPPFNAKCRTRGCCGKVERGVRRRIGALALARAQSTQARSVHESSDTR
eukprot:2312032-Pyramimonas_sp.AAC.1